MQHGTPEECAALRSQALREQQQRQALQQAAEQRQPQQAVAPAPEQAVTPTIERPAPRQERRSRGIGR